MSLLLSILIIRSAAYNRLSLIVDTDQVSSGDTVVHTFLTWHAL